MRLLYVTEATGWTGGANQAWLTAREFVCRGHSVAAACRPDAEVGRRFAQAGIPVLPLYIRQDYDLISALKLARLAREWKADLIHAHHPQAHAMALIAAYRLGGIPVVVTRQVIYPIGRNPFSFFKYRSKRISRYVAVCKPAARELEAVGVEPSRIAIIPSGVELDRWEASRLKRPKSANGRRKVVTMVGHYSRSPIKGYEVLLKAVPTVARAVPEVRFRLVGRDTEELKFLADSLGVSRHVELLGERNDVPELLSESQVYVMPSLSEGIGTALIEAQAAGVPAVASEVGGLPEVVEKDVTGLLVPPGDPDGLAEAVVKLLKNPERAQEMARLGLERVRERFSIGSVVDRLESLYLTVVPGGFK